MSIDLSVLDSSPEAIASRSNFMTLLASVNILNNNYEFLRDQNDFGRAAALAGANATRHSHLEMADQRNQEAIESFIQGSTMTAIVGGSYFAAKVKFDGQMKASENRVEASQAYLDEINERLANPRSRVVARAEDGAPAPRSADVEQRIQQMKTRSMDEIRDFNPERDSQSKKLVLSDEDKAALDVMSPEELEDLQKTVKAANKKANKAVESVSSQKQQFIQMMNQVQQTVASFGTAATKLNIASDERFIADYEYIKSLMQWVQEALNMANQISNTAIGQQNERISGIVNTMSALVQANRAA